MTDQKTPDASSVSLLSGGLERGIYFIGERQMKLSIIFEVFGWYGFSWKYLVFDMEPTKWRLRVAFGLGAITFVWGDSAAIRGFAL